MIVVDSVIFHFMILSLFISVRVLPIYRVIKTKMCRINCINPVNHVNWVNHTNYVNHIYYINHTNHSHLSQQTHHFSSFALRKLVNRRIASASSVIVSFDS